MSIPSAPSPRLKSKRASVTLSSGMSYDYDFFWDGRTTLISTAESPISFDLETELISDIPGALPPRPVLGTASNGKQSCVLHHSQLADFFLRHGKSHWVGQNFSFDFAVLDNYFRMIKREDIRAILFKAMDESRCHDTMILDQLIRLAQTKGSRGGDAAEADENIRARNLGVIAKIYLNLEVDKEDTHRLRYAELLDIKDWHALEDKGWWEYAIKDSIVVSILYRRMLPICKKLLDNYKKVYPGFMYDITSSVKQYGYLTEALQLKARIALDGITRHGMLVDQPKAKEISDKLREECRKLSDDMEVYCPGLYKRSKRTGEVLLAKTTRLPQKYTLKLKVYLQNVADREGFKAPWSKGKKPCISTSAKAWMDYADKDPLLKSWTGLKKSATLLGFYSMFEESPIIHAGYNTLVETGRTSGRKPNIQQAPRTSEFRKLFVSRPGYKILTVDYSFIELVTLATVCRHRYGFSVLADTIEKGIDPHAYTASMMIGISAEDFLTLKKTKPDEFKMHRQSAKAVNFGSPGGLGPVKLAAYAKASYGVNMTVEEAAVLRHKLLTEIYPELEIYLGDSSMQCLQEVTGLPATFIEKCLSFDWSGKKKKEELPDTGRYITASLRVLAGTPWKRATEKPYKESFIEHIWQAYQKMCKNSPLILPWARTAIESKKPSEKLARYFQKGSVATLTGRLRGGCLYTQSRNSPFQGLAADGAKLALWKLHFLGYKLLAFVHDEIVIELPDGPEIEIHRKKINEVIISSMSSVLKGAVPVSTEDHLDNCWSK
jgi:DNA polymerase family A/3'-5' exonuclease